MSALVEVSGLSKTFAARGALFGTRGGGARAVDDVSFTISRGETLGLVGESGCGKSTTGRLLLRLTGADSGSVRFDGRELLTLSSAEMRRQRRHMQIIFQDPYGSLNPSMTIGETISEAYAIHAVGTLPERRKWTAEILGLVRLPAAAAERYPHQFSGGQRQRIGIARALALRPSFVVCDEVVSALDVSVQAQIINLLQELQGELNLTCLFISHNLAVVRHISTRIAVMYLGRIVELAAAEELFRAPAHPYTRALLSSIPPGHPQQPRTRIRLKGDIPSPSGKIAGCAFMSRCAFAEPRCAASAPALAEIADGHAAACHRAADATLPG